jgi:hypothetical protein
MALPTYLELVNDVMVRMREPEVSTVNQNVLSKIVGKFINDAKRQVEDAYTWNTLSTTLTLTTTPTTYNYVLPNTGSRFKVSEVFDNTSKTTLRAISSIEMTHFLFMTTAPQSGVPNYYNFNGADGNGDTKVDIFPIPDAAYSIFFNIYQPQLDLSGDGAILLVPKEPVVHLAFAKALVERGEDGGEQSSEAYSLYRQVLADAIAIEAGRHTEEDSWVAI